MRKLGFILLFFGLLWVEFFAVEVGPWARAADTAHRQKLPEQQIFTRKDVVAAFSDAANQVSSFAQLGSVGGVLMLAGGIILSKTRKRAAVTNAPPVC